MKVFLGADHAGFELKEEVKIFLRHLGYEVADQGAFALNPVDDYPDFMRLVAQQVAADPESRGLLFGGSGQGEAMVANRFPGVRAAVFYGGPAEVINLSRVHNNANVLSIGARLVDRTQVKELIREWLSTDFPAEARHIRRLKKIDERDGALPTF